MLAKIPVTSVFNNGSINLDQAVERFSMHNKQRRTNSSFGAFVQLLIWFLDVSNVYEKLGVIRMLLCNININDDTKPQTKEAIDDMINKIQKMLEEHQKDF